MEFDDAFEGGWAYDHDNPDAIKEKYGTLFEKIEEEWNEAGYEMPMITFWNLRSSYNGNNIPAIGPKFNYISGFSMSQMEAVMSGKNAIDMMLDVLMSERYAYIGAGALGDSEF